VLVVLTFSEFVCHSGEWTSAWHAPLVPSYIEVGAPDAAVSAGRAEPTDHPYLSMIETNLLSARDADAGQ
jgi:hypothetical protein